MKRSKSAEPIYRFQNTKQPELRFCALLTDGAQEVRFERVVKGLEEDRERDAQERKERQQILQEEREEREQIRQEEREERKREREKARGQEKNSP